MQGRNEETYPPSLAPIFERKSVRAFLPEALPEEHLFWLMESLRRAPSAGNLQPWHFYVITNPEVKRLLVRAALRQSFIAEAPVVFVVCALPERSAFYYGARGRDLYVYQDTAAACENLLIAATALGYGSCWVGAFDEEEVARVLNLPPDMRPVAIIPVGKPARETRRTPRLPAEKIFTIIK